MAEEHFTSRRARREAERLAAEQAFEARSTPEQPSDSGPASRAELLSPAEPPATPEEEAPRPDDGESNSGDAAPPLDPSPAPHTVHERGALASDHPQETRPPVSAEDRLDPQRAPLPHFETRAERKRYLREHGLSARGDLSTGAIPVIAGPDEHSDEPAAHESYDTAGFGGATEEVAARDFEAPVTPDSAPRPTPVDSPRPAASPQAVEAPKTDEEPTAPPVPPVRRAESAAPAPTQSPAGADTDDTAAGGTASADAAPGDAAAGDTVPGDTDPSDTASGDGGAAKPRPRARRMPIVQPPTTAGVRVVTAASAKVPEPESSDSRAAGKGEPTAADGGGHSGSAADSRATGRDTPNSADTDAARADAGADAADAAGADAAARAMAANPETRPMDAVPEAWALPNPDYEDEETENPPGTRVRAAAVTGNDGQILVGEEPSKVPFIVLGVAALVAIGLIVVALVMLL